MFVTYATLAVVVIAVVGVIVWRKFSTKDQRNEQIAAVAAAAEREAKKRANQVLDAAKEQVK